VRLASRTCGDGEAVLWLHGYTMSSEIWAVLWNLLPGWRHIGVDLPGHGASDAMPPKLTLPALAADLAALAQPRHVIGLSFGGMIAIEVAAFLGSSLSTLVLGSSALGGGPQDADAQAHNLELKRMYEDGRRSELRTRWMSSPPDIFRGAEAHPALWSQLSGIIDAHRWDELSDWRMSDVMGRDQRRDLARIRASTLVLVGENDLPSFKRTAELLRRGIAGAQRRYVPGSHLSLIENPAAVAPLIDRHLSKGGRSSTC
jgi:pimeloyl-ACP methyl ester carboxylesterase